MTIETRRLRLRPWRVAHRAAFAAMHADPEVMRDAGGPIGLAASCAKLDRYAAHHIDVGFSRWAVEDRAGAFIGYAGVMASPAAHPTAPALQVGWRLIRAAWGLGYATEAARASLHDVFGRVRPAEVVAFTAPDNIRSRAVMGRLALRRDPARDFTLYDPKLGDWSGMVWVAVPSAFGRWGAVPPDGGR